MDMLGILNRRPPDHNQLMGTSPLLVEVCFSATTTTLNFLTFPVTINQGLRRPAVKISLEEAPPGEGGSQTWIRTQRI